MTTCIDIISVLILIYARIQVKKDNLAENTVLSFLLSSNCSQTFAKTFSFTQDILTELTKSYWTYSNLNFW